MTRRVYCLMGPTASGKTAHALTLADSLPIEVISVDATLIYRGLDIGSAKPTAAELSICPHHLIDICDPIDSYSVAAFLKDASSCIDAVFERGNIPVLVGGTMLYFRALQQGLSVLPAADAAVRAEIEAWASEQGWQVVHQALAAIDPLAAARIHPKDIQRLTRAMEVYRLTGRPLSQLQGAKQAAGIYRFVNIGLFPPRPWLHARIARRFEQMLQAGWVEEVQQLLQAWPGIVQAPALRAVGYRQVLAYIQHGGHRQILIEKGVAATRQLAKRQCTWLRSWQDMILLDPTSEHTIATIRRLINEGET